MPDKIEYRRDMAEVWGDAENNENGIYTDPNDLRTDVRQRESDEMQTVLLTGRQIYPATRSAGSTRKLKKIRTDI